MMVIEHLHSDPPERGFTLVEIMIVAAIIANLDRPQLNGTPGQSERGFR
jgi:prepilin-type N-terminal cleavage/methylation domain-containing protein